MKKKTAIAVIMLLVLALTGAFSGCGGKEDKTGEPAGTQQSGGQEETQTATPEPTATPVPTATPEPTPTPDVMPTAEELVAANEIMFDGRTKMMCTFAYKGPSEYGELGMEIDVVMLSYDNIEYQKNAATVSLMGFTQATEEEIYAVNDEASGRRTEYIKNSQTGAWEVEESLYVGTTDGDSAGSMLEEMTNVEVTKDDEFYYVTGDIKGDEVSELAGMTEGINLSLVSVTGSMKFEKETRKIVSAEVAMKFEIPDTAEGTVEMEDMVITIEALTEPIVIPEEALAANSGEGGNGTVQQGDKTELPAAWGGFYDEYDSKSGSFLMWDEDTYESIPVTVYANENWYFDNRYEHTLYLVVNDPEIDDMSPAYEVEYGDSDVSAAEPDKAPALLVGKDYNEVTTVDDVVPVVCNGKQCFYVENSAYEYVRTFIVFQDIGLDTYVQIMILTGDLTSDPLTIIEKFLLDIE